MRKPRDFKPHRPSATSFSMKVGWRLPKSPGGRKDVRAQSKPSSFLFKDLHNEIIRPKDTRDLPTNEMPLGKKARDYGSKENGGGENRPPSRHWSFRWCSVLMWFKLKDRRVRCWMPRSGNIWLSVALISSPTLPLPFWYHKVTLYTPVFISLAILT